jgi:hypothetical protein
VTLDLADAGMLTNLLTTRFGVFTAETRVVHFQRFS